MEHRLLGLQSNLLRRAAASAFALLLMLLLFTSAEAATTWNYTALGDSLAVGLWAFRGYAPRNEDYIETDTQVSVHLTNLGQPSWTSGQLLNALKTNGLFRYLVSHSRVVTWDIGGEDFLQARNSYRAKTCGGTDNQDCLRRTRDTFKRNWNAIIAQILGLRSTGNTIIRTMDLYDPYVTIDSATNTWPNDAGTDFQVFKPYVDHINHFIATTATANHIPYARVYLAFNGACGCEDPNAKGDISFDGLHPNDRGHKVIGTQIEQSV